MPDAVLASSTLSLIESITPAARFLLALIICIVACVFLRGLAWAHARRLRRIPIRIHVAGTRGKSATVRLIAAGLRTGGYRVVAKATGTSPRVILPDGSERPLRRWGAAAIREQRAFVAAAHRAGADAIVAEAMAIEPEYLNALERFYVRATDLVITNVRPDHVDQLGPAPDAMALAISEAIPSGGRLFLTTEAAIPIVAKRAAASGCKLSTVNCDADPEETNRRLALEVCRRYGVAPDVGEQAMRAATKDVGAFLESVLRIGGRTIRFANAFSCNDVQSLERLWHRHQPAGKPAAFVLNPRSDRPARTADLLALLVRLAPDAPLFIVGGGAMLRRAAVSAGFRSSRLHRLSRRISPETLHAIAAVTEEGTVVWGVGNFRGAGAELSAIAGAGATSC